MGHQVKHRRRPRLKRRWSLTRWVLFGFSLFLLSVANCTLFVPPLLSARDTVLVLLGVGLNLVLVKLWVLFGYKVYRLLGRETEILAEKAKLEAAERRLEDELLHMHKRQRQRTKE